MKLRSSIATLFYAVTRRGVWRNLRDLERFQWLSADEVLQQQRQRLLHLLTYAHQYVPYYRDLFARIGFHPADFARDPATLRQIPLLTKSIVREQGDRLITTEPARRPALTRLKTGGTTGEPLWFSRDSDYLDANVAHDYHVMTWCGWRLGDPQFWLWGHAISREQSAPPLRARLKDALLARFDADAFILTPESMERFATVLERHPGGVLWSYVSTAYHFAQFLHTRGHHIRLRAVYTAAEPLFEPQREFIQEILHCPVFNHYSSIDVGDIASECEVHHGLHILARNCYVEVLRDAQEVPDGEAGELVLTSLTSYAQPLLRYQIEDWGRKSKRRCPCGRGLPLLEAIEGRTIDMFKTRDGRIVYGAFADPLIPTLGQVRQFQVIQKSLDLIIFRLVCDEPLPPAQLEHLEWVTRASLGENVSVRFEFVEQLPSTPTGKHRFLISEVP